MLTTTRYLLSIYEKKILRSLTLKAEVSLHFSNISLLFVPILLLVVKSRSQCKPDLC